MLYIEAPISIIAMLKCIHDLSIDSARLVAVSSRNGSNAPIDGHILAD